jgi:hypothetical protein
MMEKQKRRRNDAAVAVPSARPGALAAAMTHNDVQRRAYELYCERGSEHGHDIDIGCRQRARSVVPSLSLAPNIDVAPTQTTPEQGDIVVVRQVQCDGTVVYFLHTAPGPDEYALATAEEATKHALTLADRDGVRAWLTTDDSYDFLPL